MDITTGKIGWKLPVASPIIAPLACVGYIPVSGTPRMSVCRADSREVQANPTEARMSEVEGMFSSGC